MFDLFATTACSNQESVTMTTPSKKEKSRFPIKTPKTSSGDLTTPSTGGMTHCSNIGSVESIEVTPDELWTRHEIVINEDNDNDARNGGILKRSSHSKNVSDVSWKTSFSRLYETENDNHDEHSNKASSSHPLRKRRHVTSNDESIEIADPKLKNYVRQILRDEVLKNDEIKTKLIEVLQESILECNNHPHNISESSLKDIENQRNKKAARSDSESFKNHGTRNTAISNRNNASFFPWDFDNSRPLGNTKKYSTVDRIRGLENDTFTLMMLSTRYGFAWMFLFCLFLVQLCLLIGILRQLVFDRDDAEIDEISRPLSVPIANDLFVTIGQSLAIIFALFSQRDLLEGMNVFIALWRRGNWQQLNNLPNGKRVRYYDQVFWFEKVFTSYMMKLSVSFLTLFTAMVLILQSTDLIDLLKDFTALFIVASLDNFVYSSIGDGYFGYLFDEELKRQETIRIQAKTRFTFCLCKKVPLQSFFFGLTLSIMLTTWGYVGYMQQSGTYFFEAHPNCTAFDNKNMTTKLKYEYWGDSVCDPRLYTATCGMDGGDCSNYCMTKWMNPSPKLWIDVQETMTRENKPDCGINDEIVAVGNDGVLSVNGIEPLNSSAFNFGNLYVEFSKCFDESSIYNEDGSTLGLFCYFGDFMQELSGRNDVDVKVSVTSSTSLKQKDSFRRRIRGE